LRDFVGPHYIDHVTFIDCICNGLAAKQGIQRGEHRIINLVLRLRCGFIRKSFNDRDVLYQIMGDSMTLLKILRAIVRD
jgi:hypothetical protein